MGSGVCSSENYTWYLSNISNTNRRGVGILVRKKSLHAQRIKHYYGSIITLLGYVPNIGEILFISAYVPPQTSPYNRRRSSKIFSTLYSIIDRCPKSRELILFGDFNARLGANDYWNPANVGTNLYHNTSNENGISLGLLASSANLFIKTTKGRHKPIYTWTDGHSRSQIDHILTRQKPHLIYINSLKVDSFYPEISDHCLMWITCTSRKKITSVPINRQPMPTATITSASYNFKSVNVGLLQNDNIKAKFQKELTTIYENSIQTPETNDHWKIIIDSFKIAAQKVLCTKTPLTPKRRKALAAFHSARHYKNRYPQDSNAQSAFKNARQSLMKAYNEHRSIECQEFFKNLSNYKPSERIQKTYQYLKQHKRENNITKGTYIPISSWQRELKKSEGIWPPLIDESDYCPLGPPPSEDDIRSIIKFIRSGTAPGKDGIPIEFFKFAPDKLVQGIHSVIQNVWISNEPPSEWLETIQVPIPKVKNPRNVNEYRRITLCNVGYKVYSKLLLNRLDEHLNLPSSYQAAFLANRSTEDHMFTIRRVLDEEWRAGNRIYVLSIDLSKAFDTIDLTVVSECLQQYVPHYLVNRIIKACFWEHTSIKWYNICTEKLKKNKGVKQGCPISPRIFNFILNEVLITVSDLYPELKLEQQDEIQLPLILAYADDIILITRNITTIQPILEELINSLSVVGLKINPMKCTTLIRDPDTSFNPPSNFILAGINFTRVDIMRYLGTYLSSNLSRPHTIRTRCHQSLGITKQIQNFIKKNKVPFSTAIRMYNTVIFPLITYGLKTAALTFANRRRLRKYEFYILKKLTEFSTHKPTSCKIKVILSGQTITKKIKAQRINYWGHIHRRGPTHILKAAMAYNAGPKKIGRPCYTWNESLQQDLSYYDKSTTEWEALLPNRTELRNTTKEIYSNDESDSSEILEEDDPEEHIQL